MDEIHDVTLIKELLGEKFYSIFHSPRSSEENGYKKVQRLSTGNRVFGKKVKTVAFNGRKVKILDIEEVFASKLKLHDYIPEIVIPEQNLASFEFINVDFVADTNKTPMLHLECARGDVSMVRMLVDNGAKVNRQQENGNTALMEAAFQQTDDHLDIIRILLAAGADVNIQNKMGYSMFTVATSTGNMGALKLLKEFKGPSVNTELTTRRGMTALIIAASRANRVMIRYLVEQCNANILAATNDAKWTAYNIVSTYTTDYCMKYLGGLMADKDQVNAYVKKRISALKRNTLDPQLMLTEMVSLPPLFLLESSLMPAALRRNAIKILMTQADDSLDDHDEQCYLLHRLIPWFLMLTALRCHIRPLLPETQREVVLDFFALNADELLLKCVTIYQDDDLMMFNFVRMISFLCSEEEGKKWVEKHGVSFHRCSKVTDYEGRFFGCLHPPFHPKFNVPCVQLIRCETASDVNTRATNIDIVRRCIGRCVADKNMRELIEEEAAEKRKREKKRERKKRRQQQKREEAKEKMEVKIFECSDESENENEKVTADDDIFNKPDRKTSEDEVDFGIFSTPEELEKKEANDKNSDSEESAAKSPGATVADASIETTAGPYWGITKTTLKSHGDESFATVVKKSLPKTTEHRTVYSSSWTPSKIGSNASPTKTRTSPAKRRLPVGMSYKQAQKQKKKLMKKAEKNKRIQAIKDKTAWPAQNTTDENQGTYVPVPIEDVLEDSQVKGNKNTVKPTETYNDFFARLTQSPTRTGHVELENAIAFMKARGVDCSGLLPAFAAVSDDYGMDSKEFPTLPSKPPIALPREEHEQQKPLTLNDVSKEFEQSDRNSSGVVDSSANVVPKTSESTTQSTAVAPTTAILENNTPNQQEEMPLSSETRQKHSWGYSDWSRILSDIDFNEAFSADCYNATLRQQSDSTGPVAGANQQPRPQTVPGLPCAENEEPRPLPEWFANLLEEKIKEAMQQYHKQQANATTNGVDVADAATRSPQLKATEATINTVQQLDTHSIPKPEALIADGDALTTPRRPASTDDVSVKNETLVLNTTEDRMSGDDKVFCDEPDENTPSAQKHHQQTIRVRKHHSNIEMPVVEDIDVMKDYTSGSLSQPTVIKADFPPSKARDGGDLAEGTNKKYGMFDKMLSWNATNKSVSDILNGNLLSGPPKNKPRDQSVKAAHAQLENETRKHHSASNVPDIQVYRAEYMYVKQEEEPSRFIIHLSGSESSDDSDSDPNEDIYSSSPLSDDTTDEPHQASLQEDRCAAGSEVEDKHDTDGLNGTADDMAKMVIADATDTTRHFTEETPKAEGASAGATGVTVISDEDVELHQPSIDFDQNFNKPETDISKTPKAFDIEAILSQMKHSTQETQFFPSMPSGSVFAQDLGGLLNTGASKKNSQVDLQVNDAVNGVESNAIYASDLEARLLASGSSSTEQTFVRRTTERNRGSSTNSAPEERAPPVVRDSNLSLNVPVTANSESGLGTASSGSSGTTQNEERIPEENRVPCDFGLGFAGNDDRRVVQEGNTATVPDTPEGKEGSPAESNLTTASKTSHASPGSSSTFPKQMHPAASHPGFGVIQPFDYPAPVRPWIQRSLVWHEKLRILHSMDDYRLLLLGPMLTGDETTFVMYFGRNGVLVQVGMSLDGYELALKRFLKVNYKGVESWLTKVRRLEADNRFLARYFGCIEDVHFGFLSMELCEYNLAQYLMLLKNAGQLGAQALPICYQILSGLQALHDVAMLHMNLKPNNVLIDVEGRVKLADYGLFSGTPRGHNQPYRSVLDGCWCPTEVLNPKFQGFSYTPASDVQVAGMLIHYVLTGGLHPFGSDAKQCEQNIRAGNPQFAPGLGFTAQHLLSWMLPPDTQRRKTVSECLLHPLFWQEETRFAFILAVAEQSDIAERKNTSVTNEINSYANWIGCADWKKTMKSVSVGRLLVDNEDEYSETTSDFLKFIGDAARQYRNTPAERKTHLVNPRYLEGLYPKLFLPIYDIVHKTDWKNTETLSPFFVRNRW